MNQVFATCEIVGKLLDWSDWMPAPDPPGSPRPPPLYRRERYRVLMFGMLEAARIVEYQMYSGISQFAINRIGGPRPRDKFDSFAQAYDWLQGLTDDRIWGLAFLAIHDGAGRPPR